MQNIDSRFIEIIQEATTNNFVEDSALGLIGRGLKQGINQGLKKITGGDIGDWSSAIHKGFSPGVIPHEVTRVRADCSNIETRIDKITQLVQDQQEVISEAKERIGNLYSTLYRLIGGSRVSTTDTTEMTKIFRQSATYRQYEILNNEMGRLQEVLAAVTEQVGIVNEVLTKVKACSEEFANQ